MSERNLVNGFEEEIDIKRILVTLFNYKWTIIGVALFFSLTTFAFLVTKPKVYQGSVILSAIETSIVSQNGDIQKIGLPASFYESLVKDPGFIKRVVGNYNLNLIPEDIIKEINIDRDNDPRVLKINFEAENQQTVKAVMESITNQLLEANVQLRKGEVTSSEDYILTQKKSFDHELSLIEKNLADYQKTANLAVLDQRVKDKLTLQSKDELEYAKISNDIKSEEENLKEISKHFKNEDRTYKLVRSLSDEVAFQQFTSKITKKEMSDLLSLKLESETLNPLYEDLKERLINSTISLANYQVRKEILEKEIKKIEIDLQTLQYDLIDKQKNLERFTREYDLTKEKYKEFSQREAVTRAYAPLSIGSVSLLAPIYVSEAPISQFNFKDVAISGLIGLIVGIFLSLSIEYFKKTFTKTNA